MSFIDSIDTSANAQPPQPRPNLLQRTGNTVRDFGNEALSNSQSGAQDAIRGFTDRSIDSLGRSVKNVLGEEVAKRATNPIRDAVGRVGSGMLNDVFDGFAGSDEQSIPPQYNGMTDRVQNSHEMYHGDKYALSKFGLRKDSESANDKHPAMKFMFAADFIFDPSADHLSGTHMRSIPNALTTTLKNTTFPKVEIESDEVNRYNRSIISTKKVRYTPITATFGETVGHDNGSGDGNMSLLEMWNEISSYYINDHRRPDEFSGPFGHRSGNPRRNLLKFLDLYFIWPTSTRRIRLVNPIITGFSYDNLDYQSDEQILATYDIKYEYFELKEVNGSFESFINDNIGLYLEPGTPFEFTNSSPLKNINIVSPEEEEDDIRIDSSDSPYAQAMLQLAEQGIISASSDLLGSSNPIKREVGRQAVERGMDALATANEVTGATDAVRDMTREAGRTANQALGGLF